MKSGIFFLHLPGDGAVRKDVHNWYRQQEYLFFNIIPRSIPTFGVMHNEQFTY